MTAPPPRRRSAVIAALLVAFLVVQPLVILALIRGTFADFENTAGYGRGNESYVNEAYLPAIKADLFQSFPSNGQRRIFIVGNSKSFVYSKARLEQALGCSVGQVLSLSVHSASFRSYAYLLEAIRNGLRPTDIILVVADVAAVHIGGSESNTLDLYAPWLRGIDVIRAAAGYDRHMLYPRIVDRNLFTLDFGAYTGLYELIAHGPESYHAIDSVFPDGSVRLNVEGPILEQLRAGTRASFPATQIRQELSRNFGPLDVAGVERFARALKESPAQSLFLTTMSYTEASLTDRREYAAYATLRDVLDHSFAGYPNLEVSVPANYNLFIDNTHYLPEGGLLALKSVAGQLAAKLCGDDIH